MDIASLSKVVMVRSCEEEDPKGHFLSLYDRQRAIQQANEKLTLDEQSRGTNAFDESLIVERAYRLMETLESRYPVFSTARGLTLLRIPLFLILTLALVGGFWTDPIAPKGQINLLQFPLLVLVIWNVVMYAWSILKYAGQTLWSKPLVEATADRLASVGLWVSRLKLSFLQRTSHEEKQWIGASVARFYRSWSAFVGEGMRLNGTSMLHWGAAGLAVGVIIGLYIRGFAFEYRASWSSTFLEAGQVHHLLAFILFPASKLLGVDIPSVQALAALKAPGNENAAIWIHLWAVTCLIFIVLPRVTLALITKQRALERLNGLTLPLDQPYFHRMLAQYRAESMRVEILPYQCQPDQAAVQYLEELSLGMFGDHAYVQTRAPLAYGETDIAMQAPGREALRVFIIFDVATTPEKEVHGEFLQHLQGQVERWTAGASLLVFLQEESYRSRVDPIRLHGRSQTWRRFLNGYGLEPIFLGQTGERDDDLPQQAAAKLWSGRSQEVL
ncbi:MAG: DUF2868 domain-containing protein [Nitrospirales bacterium]|nr:DUF2868 domain-containing protein [Nitrospira sp.]MDR4501407.1 DUF2868 domain-containing protein [Nitrospirales bacterium]